DYESTRQRHVAHMTARLPEYLERLTWSADRLRVERTLRLRELLRTARAHSSWHRSRLATVDVDAIDEERLRELAIMTKGDLMANFDQIVTDRRVTLDLVNAHIARLTTDAYLLDELHALASGGSSGVRGVFVWGWDAWAICWLMSLRCQVSDALSEPQPAPDPPVLMIVAADHPSHFSGAIGQTFASPAQQVCRFPVPLPLHALVEGLNTVNGRTLMTYASMLDHPGCRGPCWAADHLAPADHHGGGAVAAGGAGRRTGRLGRTDRQQLGNVRGWRRGARVLSEHGHAPVRRSPHHRARRRERRGSTVRFGVDEGLPHESVQSVAAPHSLRDRGPGDVPRRALRVRVGAPANRGHPGPSRRCVHVPRGHRPPSARLPIRARSKPAGRRVSGPADARGCGRPPACEPAGRRAAPRARARGRARSGWMLPSLGHGQDRYGYPTDRGRKAETLRAARPLKGILSPHGLG